MADGSIPSAPANGWLLEWQRVGLLSRSQRATAAKVQSLHHPPILVLSFNGQDRALSLAKRDNIVVRDGSWRMCPSI